MSRTSTTGESLQIDAGAVRLQGTLTMPEGASALVVFAHGSGSSRLSPRNVFVAEHLNERGLGTLLFDLLTAEEEASEKGTGALRFDIPLLGRRLVDALDWLSAQRLIRGSLGIFGASTGAAAALIAAAERPGLVEAVVSRGGRPDLAEPVLSRVVAPTLLIVGSEDEDVIALNHEAAAQMHAVHELRIVAGATHLFEEPGKLAEVAELAADWLERYLRPHDEGQAASVPRAKRSRPGA